MKEEKRFVESINETSEKFQDVDFFIGGCADRVDNLRVVISNLQDENDKKYIRSSLSFSEFVREFMMSRGKKIKEEEFLSIHLSDRLSYTIDEVMEKVNEINEREAYTSINVKIIDIRALF